MSEQIYLSQDRFEYHVGKMVAQLVATPELKDRINIVITNEPGRSERWVIHAVLLAMAKTQPEALARVNLVDVSPALKDGAKPADIAEAKKQLRELENLVVIDDIVYSGAQLNAVVGSLGGLGYKNKILVSPVGATATGTANLENLAKDKNVKILGPQLAIPGISSLLERYEKELKEKFQNDSRLDGDNSEKKMESLWSLFNDMYFTANDAPLFYTDFKLAEAMISTLGSLSCDGPLHGDVFPAKDKSKGNVMFLSNGKPKPPYKPAKDYVFP